PVASGNSNRLVAHTYCDPRLTRLRKTCSGNCRVKSVERRSARAAVKAAMITKPKPERTARISMTLSVAANSRIDTAIAENESNAPVIHRTTRMRWLEVTLEPSLERSIARGSDRRASLRVGLILRPRPFEGRKPQA